MSNSDSNTSTSRPSSSSLGNQPLRWSLQNFPVPVQLQPRIPRSPLAVAQELLPNFPSQLLQQLDTEQQQQQQQSHQYQMSLQRQLQQQFQRQLQLNLQSGGNEPATLPDPPDTVLDMDTTESQSSHVVGSGGFRGAEISGSTNGGNSGVFGGGLASTNLLEALLRSAQAASVQQRNSGSQGDVSVSGNGSSGSYHSHGAHHHHHSANSALQLLNSGSSGDDGSVGAEVTGAHVPSGHMAGGPNAPQTGDAAQPASDLSLLTKWITESGIFILLLLLHFLYDHRLGLLVFLCLGGTFYYTNMKLVHAIHQSAVRKQTLSWLAMLNLMWLCGFLAVNVILLYYVFADQRLWRLLFFQMAAVDSIPVWTLLWCVVLTDYIVKFLTVILKACVALMQPFFRNYRKRGKYYLLIESISQLYRQLVTVVPWLFYLNDNTRTSLWFAFLTEIVYLAFKSWSVWAASKLFYTSFLRFSSNTTFGTKPGSSDMLERGGLCPICQDSVKEPVMLACKHIFCEQCVSIWLDREKTCPMCRAEITADSPIWKDGNTSAHLQWH